MGSKRVIYSNNWNSRIIFMKRSKNIIKIENIYFPAKMDVTENLSKLFAQILLRGNSKENILFEFEYFAIPLIPTKIKDNIVISELYDFTL